MDDWIQADNILKQIWSRTELSFFRDLSQTVLGHYGKDNGDKTMFSYKILKPSHYLSLAGDAHNSERNSTPGSWYVLKKA